MSIFIAGKQVTIRYSGTTTKTSNDWICQMKSGYRPYYNQTFHSCEIGANSSSASLYEDGTLYLDGLATNIVIGGTITYNIA